MPFATHGRCFCEMQPMNESQRAQIKIYLSRIDGLIQRGQELREALVKDPAKESAIALTRVWQEECGATIHQLSGGSKAHWLARLFSGAFLMRSADGRAVEEAAPAEIVNRLLGVLEQAVASLSQMEDSEHAASSEAAQTPHRFEFVHNHGLKPVLERAYADSLHAIEQGDFDLALVTTCGILEAIVTDALENVRLSASAVVGLPANIADWSFETRLDVAEKAGLIRNGCARLPDVARSYRDHKSVPKLTVSELDALKAGQVLRVVMRDLDPGR